MSELQLTFLSQLTAEVCLDFFKMWIDTKDIVLLDTALNNKKERSIFLDLLKDDTLSIHIWRNDENLMFGWDVSVVCFQWIILRGIKLNALKVNASVFENNELRVNVATSKVTELTFFDIDEGHLSAEGFATMINACPQLSALVIEDQTVLPDDTVLAIKSSILSQLTVVTYCKADSALKASTVDYLAANCHNMISFHVYAEDTEQITSSGATISLLQSNPNLKELTMTFSSSLESFFTCIPAENKLQKVQFYSEKLTSFHSTIQFIVSNQSLNTVKLLTDTTCDASWLHFERHYQGVTNTSYLSIDGTTDGIEDIWGNDVSEIDSDHGDNAGEGDDSEELQQESEEQQVARETTELCKRLQIKTLHVTGMTFVEGEVYNRLIWDNCSLETLVLMAYCDVDSVERLQQTLRTCEQLTSLQIDNCNELPNSDLLVLFNETPHKLKNIDITHHRTLDRETVNSILQHNSGTLNRIGHEGAKKMRGVESLQFF